MEMYCVEMFQSWEIVAGDMATDADTVDERLMGATRLGLEPHVQ